MIKTIKTILALIIVAATSLSCDLAFLSDEKSSMDGDMTIVVNGIVSDVATNAPINEMKVTFSAFAENSISILPLVSKTVYTDAKGEYLVEVYGFSECVTCILTAESTDQNQTQYKSQENKIVVTWSGSSFDDNSNTFYVNDCNFQMKKN